MIEQSKKILGITVVARTKKEVLEQIKKYISLHGDFVHVVSLNPENLVISQEDREFKEIVEASQIKIVDGVGVAIAGIILGIPTGERLTGVDLMQELVKVADEGSLSVGLIGAQGNLANKIAECYSHIYRRAQFFGLEGFNDIQNPTREEIDAVSSIVTARRPRLLFTAFGSPAQEKWMWRNRPLLQGVVCIGVGGAFDYIGGEINRPVGMIRSFGLEWLYRLIQQPWRWKRQIRLIKFICLVLKQRCGLL